MKPQGKLRKNVSVINLDELILQLRRTVNTLDAVQVAMTEGSNQAEYYTDALLGVLINFWNLIDRFSQEIYEEDIEHEEH